MIDEQWSQMEPGKPACYRIAVRGCLDEKKWSGRLGGMQIKSQKESDQQAVTVLSGEVQDQADLIGVLNTLHQMRMTILSVICEDCNEPEATETLGTENENETTN